MKACKYNPLRLKKRVDSQPYIFVENWHTPKCFPFNVNQVIEYFVKNENVLFHFSKRGYFSVRELIVSTEGELISFPEDMYESDVRPMAKYLVGFLKAKGVI